jgi:basic membrane protein A and related proteins
MNRRNFLTAAAGVLAGSLALFGSGDLTARAEGTGKIAVLLSPEGRGDLGWNDLAWRGAELAKQQGYIKDYSLLVSNSGEILSLLTSLAQSKQYDLIVSNSWSYVKALVEVANAYPNVNFVQIDTDPQIASGTPASEAVLGMIFNQEQMSALAGALAAFTAVEYDTPHVGIVLGREGSILHDFEIGYKWGVDWGMKWLEANDPAKLKGKAFAATDPTKRVLWTYTGTFADPAKGKAAAQVQLKQGAGVVYQVAAGTGLGVLGAVDEYHKEHPGNELKAPFAIGVDADQDWINPHIIASGMKRVDLAVLTGAKLVAEGKFRGSVAAAKGVMSQSLANDGVALSDEKILSEFIQFATAAGALDEAKAEGIQKNYKALRGSQPAWFWQAIGELESKIRSGQIVVPKPSADPAKFNIRKLREIYG